MAKLSDRLMAIYRLIPNGARVADIGTDHAAIPIALLETAKSPFIIASDVRKGPLFSAQEQIELADLDNPQQIELRLGSGLSVLQEDDDIDTIVMAGMGGELIAKLIEKIPTFLADSLLILQANNEEGMVREVIIQQKRTITDEKIIQEGRHFYEIIVSCAAGKPKTLTNRQMKFGPFLLEQNSDVFRLKWQKKRKHLANIKKILEESKQQGSLRYDSLQEEIKEIDEVLM
ncbi:tRNA (adenine(22)-N(1))-methyltransferase [Oenococcus kitaharae]|uniref:Putative tRNA-m1A22 methylase n=1 Tax=Oenococcus kitaharae DSM 17330 TaxID=1045004 RepID=G9WH44_9LACO|nr:class I SAM-dependent methyltransferase [Oenococcus kitaharae]EHN59533.1 Putative tRNA-m1A22 methylase [Oenococcus kitaharae DSM 17330]OEY83672.1 SAM-dependent methyltransferase [Oenococcus kitaharae]OEY85469.1 SAM-dependent methyltransferase [Oenococcus kitaharae]OEY86323.1 SAM-dependent methyltransferase [Oenococcus kitaharae]